MTWKKGVSGNPNGRPTVVSEAIRSEAEKNRAAVKALVLRLLNMKESEIQEVVSNPDSPFIEKHIAKALITAHNLGLVSKFLLEVGVGSLIEQKQSDDLTEDEKQLVQEFRTFIAERQSQKSLDAPPGVLEPKTEPEDNSV